VTRDGARQFSILLDKGGIRVHSVVRAETGPLGRREATRATGSRSLSPYSRQGECD